MWVWVPCVMRSFDASLVWMWVGGLRRVVVCYSGLSVDVVSVQSESMSGKQSTAVVSELEGICMTRRTSVC